MRKNLPSQGFTLVELMVVMAVIAVLATMALFGLGKAQAAARDVQRQQIMSGIRMALERYNGDQGYYPISYSHFCHVVCVLNGVWGQGSYMGYPIDPVTKQPICDGCDKGSSCTGTDAAPICGGATYQYNNPTNGVNCREVMAGGYTGCDSYTLRLVKESGGYVEFKSPQ